MRKQTQSLVYSLVLLLLLQSCNTQDISNSSQINSLSEVSRYECIHGLSNEDYYTSGIIYSGKPITVDYNFTNTNMDSNFGLMLFVDGFIQPFSLGNNTDCCNYQIVSLSKESKNTTVNITFNPILGMKGDILDLHIIAIFDMGTDYNAPTIAQAFYHNMSQSLPISIIMDEDAQPSVIAKYLDYNQCEIEINDTSQQDGNTSCDISLLNKPLYNQNLSIDILNGFSNDAQYYLYVYINNNPVKINGESFLKMTYPATSKTNITMRLQGEKNCANDLLYLLAIPVGFNDQFDAPLVLKMKTVPLDTE